MQSRPEAAADLAAETAQRRALNRHRFYATALLVVMAAAFVAGRSIPDPGFWVALLTAGAEAALVGGLADWFAVTALFRRPLGLPIPHTAIIRRNKDRIGEGIGRFVESNFLAPELVAAKLRALAPAAALADWLAERDNAEAVARRLARALPFVLDSLHDREVRAFVARALADQLHGVEASPLLGRVLAMLTARGHHQALFERSLVLLRRFLAEREPFIYRQVSERSHWLIPKQVDRRIAEAIVSGIEDLLGGLADPDHELRRRFDEALADTIEKLQQSPEWRARGEEIKDELMASPLVQDYLGSVWDRLRTALQAELAADDSGLRRGLADAVQALGRNLARDADMQARLNRRIEQFVLVFVVPRRAEIGQFIAEVVRGWDARTVTDKIELAVGRDLQYIRINGTVVGALVGCALYLLSHTLF